MGQYVNHLIIQWIWFNILYFILFSKRQRDKIMLIRKDFFNLIHIIFLQGFKKFYCFYAFECKINLGPISWFWFIVYDREMVFLPYKERFYTINEAPTKPYLKYSWNQIKVIFLQMSCFKYIQKASK